MAPESPYAYEKLKGYITASNTEYFICYVHLFQQIVNIAFLMVYPVYRYLLKLGNFNQTRLLSAYLIL